MKKIPAPIKSGPAVLSVTLGVLTLISLSSFFPQKVAADSCGGPFPEKPAKVWTKAGPGAGQISIYWDEVAHADRYAAAYGTEPGNYMYGATDIGDASSRSYTVAGLSGGTRYYFALAAARDCSSSPFSDEVSAYAAGGAVSVSQSTVKPEAVSADLSAVSGPSIGQVTLRWMPRDDADNYHVMYGTSPDFQYGALNIGKVTEFTVGLLVPGRMYHFAIVPVKGDRALYTSGTVSAYAKAPVVVTTEVIPDNLKMEQQPEAMMLENDPAVTDESDESEYEAGYGDAYDNDEGDDEEDYAMENTTLDENVYGIQDVNVGGFDDDYEPEDENYAAENEAVGDY